MFRVGWVGWRASRGVQTSGFGISSFARFRNPPQPPSCAPLSLVQQQARNYSSILGRMPSLVQNAPVLKHPLESGFSPSSKLLVVPEVVVTTGPVRTLIKFSRQKGIRKSVKSVLKRFKRLDWGAWIRTRSGRHKKLWKKSPPLKRRLRQHVFTNATQSWLLDKMVTSFWRRPKYYVNDPYRPYHSRAEYMRTRR